MHYPLNKYFKLYSDCVVNSGYKNSILLDFTRPDMSNFVPNELSDFIEKCIDRTLHEVLNIYSKDDRKVIVEYLDFLIKNDFGFFVSENLKNNFPPITTKLKNSPEIIDNLILEFDSNNIAHLKTIHILIEKCLVSSVEIRGIKLSIEEINQIVQVFSSSVVQSLNIYLDTVPEGADLELLIKIRTKNARIKKLVVFESSNIVSSEDGTVHFLSKKFCADKITRANIINLSYHLEAQNVCTYRYKKLFIDKEGNFKNHPNSNELIGNIDCDEITNLTDKLKQECETNKNWYITRSQINVCKDCEFRTVCYTNNLPVKGSNYFLKSECTYNPYIGKAKGEEGYLTLAECGVTSDENGFSIDHEKIAKINEELWGEE